MGWVVGSCLFGLGCLGLKVNRTGPIFFDLGHSLSLSLSLLRGRAEEWRPWQKALRSALIDIRRHHHRRRWFSIDFPLSIPPSLSWLIFPVSLSLSITTQTPKTIQILKLTGRTLARAEWLPWSPIYDDLRPNGFTGRRTQRTKQERLNIFLLFFPLPCPGWTRCVVIVSDTGT